MAMQQYCLRWNNHQPNFISVFSNLLNNESLVDVTLSADGRHLQAHRLVLSACSSYFQSLFTINPCQHPIVILKDVKFTDLKVIIDFMYYGEVNVSQEQLPHILKTAEMLKIKGLAEIPVEQSLAKSQNNTERTELLTTTDSNWNVESQQQQQQQQQRQSLSPSPCPLSPTARRKRLRKSSTGSGSGSTERTSDEQQTNTTSDITLTSPGLNLATVIKPDPGGFTTDSSNTLRIKQHSSDSDLHRGSSHESVESEPPHQITLQIPQQQEINIQETISVPQPIEVAGPSSTSSQTVPGYQWGIMEHSGYPHYVTQPNVNPNIDIQFTNTTVNNPNMAVENFEQKPNITQINTNSPPQMLKRKRNMNPQGEENFVRALEAVRFGGIGFCKAARMFGVNNRTLWLEYKKRGYPISRLSIKNKKSEYTVPNQPSQQSNSPPVNCHQEQEVVVTNPNNNVSMVNSSFMEARPVDVTSTIQRSRFFDTNINTQHTVNLQAMSFEPI